MNSNDNFDLSAFLHSFNAPLHFIANPGNAGDSLIASATFQFLKKHNIPYTLVTDINADLSDKVVVYAGGGNFGGENSRVGKYIETFAFACKQFILLPHTLFGAEELLSRLPKTTHLVCRERVSFEHASKHCKLASVYLHDDMVINSEVFEFLSAPANTSIFKDLFDELIRRLQGKSDYDFGISLSCVIKFQIYKMKQFFAPTKPLDKKVLNAFRTDVEKTDIELPTDNIDVSALYELSSCDPKLVSLSTYRFLQHINRYDIIKTNRLHVAIGAMKLNKTVHLYGNNYFKIKAIYDYSIKGKYENVKWFE